MSFLFDDGPVLSVAASFRCLISICVCGHGSARLICRSDVVAERVPVEVVEAHCGNKVMLDFVLLF